MSAELDMSQYVDLFLQEGEEQIEVLERETLGLEQDPSDDRLQVIFRAAHTLKGSSRAMGYSSFAELTHEMENILDQLRQHILSVNTEIADCLLATIDKLSQMTDSIRGGNGDGLECAALVKRLQAITSAPSAQVTADAATSLQPSANDVWPFPTRIDPNQFKVLEMAATEGPVFHVKFRLVADCAMKFVRAFMAISVAQDEGELLACYPTQEDLEEEKFDTDFELVFQSQISHKDLEKKFHGVSEVDKLWIGKWATPTDTETISPSQIEEGSMAHETPALATSPVHLAGTLGARRTESGQTVRVDVSRLDSLMNLVGELVIDRTRIAQIGADLATKFKDSNIEALGETVAHIARTTTDLQDQIMKARMLPIETVFNRFPRVVRDLAQKLGKDVELVMVGGETELDRSVIEIIGDPLLHILRNSIDHGLENPMDRAKAGKPPRGTVRLSARHKENHIVIEISDDGKGIDAQRIREKVVESGLLKNEDADKLSDKEALQYIFSSGFSTSEEVSEVSGRGVGMDIVRANMQKLAGLIDIDTTLGAGTKFSLRLPLTLAIIRGLLVTVSENVFVLPLGSVIETIMFNPSEIQRVNQREVVIIRGMTTPLVRLDRILCAAIDKPDKEEEIYAVIVGLAEQRVGFVVDGLIGEQEVVIKSLSRFCGDVSGVSGATILGDGNVALIIDVNGIISS